MNGFLGADTQALRETADRFSVGERAMRDVLERSAAQVFGVAWTGPDRDAFLDQWQQVESDAISRCEIVGRLAMDLRDQAEDQDRISEDTAADSGDRGDGDHPDNPGLEDDLGEYEEYHGKPGMSDEDLSMDEMNQGSIGDCWFLAGLGGIAQRDPDWIRDHMWKNPDGTWTVKMYEDGDPVYIQVEPTFPENGAVDSDGEVSYATIYEKAAAEYFGGDYSDIDGGFTHEAFEAIYGRPAQREGETDFASIEEALERGPVAVGTEDNPEDWNLPWTDTIDDDSIVPNHAYVVEEIVQPTEENGYSEPMIVLRNPWGPDGGTLDGQDRAGTLVLTEDEYHDSFDSTYSMEG